MRAALLALAYLSIQGLACQRERAAPAATDLAAYLASLAGADLATREAAVNSWRLDEAAWQHVTTDPYRAAYADYARQFAIAAPALVAQLGQRGAVTTRAHFADDPKLTRGQARARWAQPVQAPSEIAELAGAPIDAVFVSEGGRWGVIVGVDAIIAARTAALAPGCAEILDHLAPGPCLDAAWGVAEAALRGDRSRLARACAQVSGLCR